MDDRMVNRAQAEDTSVKECGTMNRNTLRTVCAAFVTIVFALTATAFGASAEPAPSTDLPVDQAHHDSTADGDQVAGPLNWWTYNPVTTATDSDDASESDGVVVVEPYLDTALA
jgi:hypothetical protein